MRRAATSAATSTASASWPTRWPPRGAAVPARGRSRTRRGARRVLRAAPDARAGGAPAARFAADADRRAMPAEGAGAALPGGGGPSRRPRGPARRRAGENVSVPEPEVGEAMELVQQGMSLASLGHPEDALARYDRAPRSRPERGRHPQQPGELAVEDGPGRGSPRRLRSCPRAAAALRQRLRQPGAGLRAGRAAAEGMADCEQALALNARNAEAWVTRAVALAGLGRREEAIASSIAPSRSTAGIPWPGATRRATCSSSGATPKRSPATTGRSRWTRTPPSAGWERARRSGRRDGTRKRWPVSTRACASSARTREACYNKGNSFVQLQRYEEALALLPQTNQLAPGRGIP